MLIQLFLFLLGLVGASLVSVGVWLINPAAGYICIGLFCLLASFMYTRQLALQQMVQRQKADS